MRGRTNIGFGKSFPTSFTVKSASASSGSGTGYTGELVAEHGFMIMGANHDNNQFGVGYQVINGEYLQAISTGSGDGETKVIVCECKTKCTVKAYVSNQNDAHAGSYSVILYTW